MASVVTEQQAPLGRDDVELAERMSDGAQRVRAELRKRIIGQDAVIDEMLLTLFVGGNSLIIGVPGLAKTLLVQTLAQVLALDFARIQFTPDLMPSDITGTDILQEDVNGRRTMTFAPGPVFTNVLLADEINRTPPKTQSALLEAMQEHRVTVQGRTYTLEEPFHVFATQNPIELEGTYPLPEAQLDRFLIRISLGYPGHRGEVEILNRQHYTHPLNLLEQVVGVDELLAGQEMVKRVFVDDSLKEYIVSIVEATREHDDVYLGAGPRGSLALYNTARAWAAMAGRDYVIPDDIKDLAEPTLAHRLIVSPSARMKNVDGRMVVREILMSLPVPGARPTSPSAERTLGWRGTRSPRGTGTNA